MTKNDLFSIWERYMHRSDLTADMETTYTLTQQMVRENALMAVDLDDMLQVSPAVLMHGGLMYLHELNRDSEGQAMEEMRFRAALQAYELYQSRTRNATISPFTYEDETVGT